MIYTVCCLLLCLSISNSYCQLTSNTIPEQINGGSPIVAATDSSNTTMILCEIFNGDTQFITSWRLITDGVPVLLSFTVNGTANNIASQPFSVTGEPSSQTTTQSNLTIINFTSSLDTSVLECFSNPDTYGNFTLRLIATPVLLQDADRIVTEGDSFNISIQQSIGFPEDIISYQWFYNNAVIMETSVNPNITQYPLITFDNVNRTASGNYSIVVYHDGGTVTGSIILDVQYGPEGIIQSTGPLYRLAGDDITITSFLSINGNPFPSSVWSSTNGVITDGGRFNTSVPGQLTITSLNMTDTGNYTNVLMNTVDGTPISISNTIEIKMIAVIPSQPREVNITGTGAEYVNISWRNPIELGSPVITQFRIEAISSINTVNVTIAASDNTDPNYINVFMLNGLKPNTEYSLTVRALSTVEQLGLLTSEPSDIVQFNTTLGVPSISTATLQNINGNLTISWEFLHTGGSELDMITVQCAINDDDDDVSSSGDSLSVMLICPEQCITDSVTIGPVIAGMNYSCLITAENMIGDDEMRTNNILTNTGIPSVPVVTNVTGGAGLAYITLRIDNYGTTIANDFILTVTVFDEGDITNPIDTRDITPDSINNPVITLLVDNLPEGMLIFTVSASNVYGTPLMATNNMTVPVTIQPTTINNTSTTMTIIIGPSTTTNTISSTSSIDTTTSTTSIPTNTIEANSSGLSGGAIAGIIIAIIILIAIIAIVVFIVIYIIYQNRGDSYRVEGGKVFVEEHDIDLGTVLQDRKSVDGGIPEKATDETTIAQPKQELHYADLADFSSSRNKNSSSNTETAKPMPIEEVQYAVIRPQDLKQNGDN